MEVKSEDEKKKMRKHSPGVAKPHCQTLMLLRPLESHQHDHFCELESCRH